MTDKTRLARDERRRRQAYRDATQAWIDTGLMLSLVAAVLWLGW